MDLGRDFGAGELTVEERLAWAIEKRDYWAGRMHAGLPEFRQTAVSMVEALDEMIRILRRLHEASKQG